MVKPRVRVLVISVRVSPPTPTPFVLWVNKIQARYEVKNEQISRVIENKQSIEIAKSDFFVCCLFQISHLAFNDFLKKLKINQYAYDFSTGALINN